MPKVNDKRVFEIHASITGGDDVPRVVAISADATILDLHLALLGAFKWAGDYDRAEREYRVSIGGRVFEHGKGSLTPLRRVLEVGTDVQCDTFDTRVTGEVSKTYEVASRRHYPKVMESGGDGFDVTATWRAQSAMRRELRGTGDVAAVRGAPDTQYLEARLHGYFAAIVSGPLIMPSEWLPNVVNFNSIPDAQAAQETVSGIMALYNAVARELQDDREAFTARVGEFAGMGNGDGLIEWSRGYFSGVELRATEWERFSRSKEVREIFAPLVFVHFECGRDPQKREWLADAELRGNLARACALAAIGIREMWRERLFQNAQPVRRSQPKISPNTPCACGSGKKYKRCCGSPVRLVKS